MAMISGLIVIAGHKDYGIRHIFRGVFIFANFASLVLFANLTTHKNIYLRSRLMNATCVRNTSSTVHSARANEWRISPSIALLDRDFNHLRKCLEIPIREKLDSQNIWRIWPLSDACLIGPNALLKNQCLALDTFLVHGCFLVPFFLFVL